MGNKPAISHIDLERFRLEKMLRNKLKNTIAIFLQWVNKDSYCQPLFQKAIESLALPQVNDDAALTLGSSQRGIYATRKNPIYGKYHCLLIATYHVVKQWHRYLRKELSFTPTEVFINYLAEIAEKGLDAYYIRGNIKQGYRLQLRRNRE